MISAAIQGDNLDIAAQQIVPYLKDITVEGDAQKVLDAIMSWDFHTTEDRASAPARIKSSGCTCCGTPSTTIWAIWRRITSVAMMSIGKPVIQLLAQPDAKWWDNAAPPDRVETRDDILKQSLADAARDLVAEYGANPDGWQWGKLHTVTVQASCSGRSARCLHLQSRAISRQRCFTALVNNTGGSFRLRL